MDSTGKPTSWLPMRVIGKFHEYIYYIYIIFINFILFYATATSHSHMLLFYFCDLMTSGFKLKVFTHKQLELKVTENQVLAKLSLHSIW